ncbi:MAG: tetratricopeptide repeat protein [Gemmatimonadales bacterium]|nr:MAG: tetratricopeptide repeat protein [Gemmatimonadales bacterium]
MTQDTNTSSGPDPEPGTDSSTEAGAAANADLGPDAPSSQSAGTVEARRLLSEALEADRRGETEVARRRYEEALELNPTDPEIRTAWGRALMTRARHREAEVVLRALCEEDPGQVEAHRVLGEVLHRMGGDADALEVLERAAELDPGHPRPWYLMGLVHDGAGRPEQAAAMYRRSRERTASR